MDSRDFQGYEGTMYQRALLHEVEGDPVLSPGLGLGQVEIALRQYSHLLEVMQWICISVGLPRSDKKVKFGGRVEKELFKKLGVAAYLPNAPRICSPDVAAIACLILLYYILKDDAKAKWSSFFSPPRFIARPLVEIRIPLECIILL